MKHLFAAAATLLLLPPLLRAQEPLDGFLGRIHKSGKDSMPYRLFIPSGYDRSISYPIVIWLHGGGSAGTDNVGQISRDNTLGTHFWTRKENQEKHPSFVLAPQSPGGWDNNAESQLSRELTLVLEILDAVRKEYSIDPARIYIAGQSNGGVGTWGLLTKKPGLFAAALPLCGAGNPRLVSSRIHTAVWAFHGEKDDVINAESSRVMIAAMKRAGSMPRYTEYKGVGHDIWEKVFMEPELEDWLFAQRLERGAPLQPR